MLLKNKNIIFKIRRSKVTDFAALSSFRYGDISIFQADFSFKPSKLIIQTLIVDKCSKTISMLFALL